MMRGGLTGPSDEAIGAHEHGAQTQPILRVACDICDPTPPSACKRLKRRGSVKVQQQAFPVPEELAELRPASQLEVGGAAAHERMAAAKIIKERNAPHAIGEVGRAVARVDEIPNDGFERALTPGRPHERDLGARPVKNLRSQRLAFTEIAVDETGRRVATDGRSQLPTQVHRIAKAEVQALPAQG